MKLCHLDDIPEGGSRGLSDGRLALLAVRRNGRVFVYENVCPHLSLPLEWQPDQFLDYERRYIQCATHGALFEIESGLCIAGPCVDDRLTPVAVDVTADGWVVISQAEPGAGD